MRDLIADVRYAARALAARPAFTAAIILTLGLGTAGTTTMFGVVNGVIFGALPFDEPGRLITLCEQYPGSSAAWCSVSPPNVTDIAARARSIETIGLGRGWPYHLVTPTGAEEINGGLASPELFAALRVRAERGRLITSGDMLGRPSTVAVIAHEMWRDRFGEAADIVGRTVVLDAEAVTIVGVLEPGFQLPKFEDVQLWRPLHIDPRDERNREWRGFVAYGRLAPGATMAGARAELTGIVSELRRGHFATTPGWDIVPMSLEDLVVGGVKRTLFVFLGAVTFLLLIACANVANLLLSRITERSRELALRAALGAGRGRLMRVMLVEGGVLAVMGSAVGLVLAIWGTRAFRALEPAGIPRLDGVAVDGRVLVFALGVAMVTTVLFGLPPALRGSRVDLARSLREGGRTAAGGRATLGGVLVVAQLALAVVLVTGAGLLARSFVALASWNPGFDQEHLLTFSTSASGGTYQRRAQVAALWDRAEAAIAAVPGVVAVGTASAGPLFGGRETWEVLPEGRSSTAVSARWYDVSPGFFGALGVPLVRGRLLDARDREGSPFYVLVNESLASRYWPGIDPIGRRIVWRGRGETVEYSVVGVVRDIPPLTPGDPVESEMYWSNRQLPRPFTFFVVRTARSPASVASAVRAALKSVDRDLDARGVLTMPERVDRALRRPRFNMLLLIVFGVTSLGLAMIGTYGLIAYAVAQRTREIGIRVALGARRGQIMRDVLVRGLRLAGIGISLGVVGALALGHTMSDLVAGVSTHDPATLVLSALVLAVAAALACLTPAFRASHVDPVVTLSAE